VSDELLSHPVTWPRHELADQYRKMAASYRHQAEAVGFPASDVLLELARRCDTAALRSAVAQRDDTRDTAKRRPDE